MPSYSQESLEQGIQLAVIEDMLSGPIKGTGGSNALFRKPDISGDTVRLRHDESYVLFIGVFQEIINASYGYREFKVKSVIRGSVDTTASNWSIVRMYNLKICSDIKFEVGKDYLVLEAIQYDRPRIGHYVSPLKKCEDILPDTPENRQKLIKKYEEKIIMRKPKPAEISQ